jgi:hypothetical protein
LLGILRAWPPNDDHQLSARHAVIREVRRLDPVELAAQLT